jgi:hypothetical protein
MIDWSNRDARYRLFFVVGSLQIGLMSQPPVCLAQSQPATTSLAAPGASLKPVSEDWSKKASLPILKCDVLRPIKSPELFAIDALSVSLPKDKSALPMKGAVEKPFEKDDEAVAAARAWIVEYFGPTPEGMELRTKSVESKKWGSEERPGHRVEFESFYHNMELDFHCHVGLCGRSVVKCDCRLAKPQIVGRSETLVSADAAKAAWREIFARGPKGAETVKAFDRNAKPRLQYHWCPLRRPGDPEFKTPDLSLQMPTWVLDDEGLVMVDAHLGKPWFND